MSVNSKRLNPSVSSLDKYIVSDTGVMGEESSRSASYAGVVVKIAIYLAIALVTAIASTALIVPLASTNPGLVVAFLVGAPIVALITGVVASLSPSASAIAGSIYCACYGLLIGAISAILDATGFGGLVTIALLCTVVVAGVMSLLYFSGTVRVGSRFRKFILTALISIIVCQLLFWIVSFFTPALAILYANNFGLQLAICAVMVVIASLTILVDLDHISMVVESGLGKKYEWRAAFGLMVTLIWLFLQILRLLLIIAASRK